MAFRVGQKVVCVFDGQLIPSRPGRAVSYFIRKGEVYEIGWVGEFPFADDRGEQAVRLCGIDRGPDVFPEYNNYPFAARRFRPVVSTDTGMAILEQIRRDATKKTSLPARESA